MGLLNSFTKAKAGLSTTTGGDHKQSGQRQNSSSSSTNDDELLRLSLSMDGSKNKKNADDGAVPAAVVAPPAPGSHHSFSSNENANQNANNEKVLPKRWIPKKTSGLFTSFASRRNHHSSRQEGSPSVVDDHVASSLSNTSAAGDLASLLQEINDDDNFKKSLKEEGGVQGSQQPQKLSSSPPPRRPSRRPSIISSEGSMSEEEESFVLHNDNNDLDIQASSPLLDSESMLAKLGNSPSSSELANVAAVRANEYINECLFDSAVTTSSGEGHNVTSTSGVYLDRQKWESIPQYSKSDLLIRKHLGKGSFSDAFEVSVMVTVEDKRLDSSEKDDLDRLIEAKFATNTIAPHKIGTMTTNKISEGEDEDLDKQIDAIFGNGTTPKKVINEDGVNDRTQHKHQDFQKPPENRLSSTIPPRRNRCQTITEGGGVSASFCIGRTQASTRPIQKKQTTYAMKCLRPQIRSNAKEFIEGVEDLVHETAMLASLDHPNIIKLYGRAGGGAGGVSSNSSLRLSDGYFILLDRLQDTLEDRIARWGKAAAGGSGSGNSVVVKSNKAAPSLGQIKTACSIAGALSYLHSKNIVFRDLKPANVGFDSRGVLKLFDFGFAIGLDDGNINNKQLYDMCGTPRYMAPEVRLGLGYSFPVDVHSFGILLWEICSLKKPFGNIKSSEEFRKSVFEKGVRPKLAKYWPQVLKDTMCGCWCSEPGERPTMEVVTPMLGAHMKEVSSLQHHQQNNDTSLRKISMFRRLTG